MSFMRGQCLPCCFTKALAHGNMIPLSGISFFAKWRKKAESDVSMQIRI
jgi:hypothetical protein